jgi:hypothetical protein
LSSAQFGSVPVAWTTGIRGGSCVNWLGGAGGWPGRHLSQFPTPTMNEPGKNGTASGTSGASWGGLVMHPPDSGMVVLAARPCRSLRMHRLHRRRGGGGSSGSQAASVLTACTPSAGDAGGVHVSLPLTVVSSAVVSVRP